MEVYRMKRIYVMLLGLLLLCGCADGSTGGVMPDNGETAAYEEEGEEAPEPMDDLMKISTWVLDPELEGKGYWAYSDDYRTHNRYGYWVPNEGESDVDEDKVFVKEQLRTGKVYTMAPMGYQLTANLNLYFEFDGLVTVEKTEPADNTILTVFNTGDTWSNQWSGETVVSAYAPCTVNILPVGKILGSEGGSGLLIWPDTLAGKEYLLTVKGYELDGSLMVTAQIKLTTLEDAAYPYEEVVKNTSRGYSAVWQAGEKRTRFCSVEVVSYEYSDQYKMMMTE